MTMPLWLAEVQAIRSATAMIRDGMSPREALAAFECPWFGRRPPRWSEVVRLLIPAWRNVTPYKAREGNMTVYLLHFDPPLHHARHYLGWTGRENILARLEEHFRGHKGSSLVAAAYRAGCRVTIARIWPGMDRNFERALKNGKAAPSLCPLCTPSRRKYKYWGAQLETGGHNEQRHSRTGPGAGQPGAAICGGAAAGPAGAADDPHHPSFGGS